MNCPLCGMPAWTSKSEPVALCKGLYRRSIRCDTCADGKTLAVYRTSPVSDRELAREYQKVRKTESGYVHLTAEMIEEADKVNQRRIDGIFGSLWTELDKTV